MTQQERLLNPDDPIADIVAESYDALELTQVLEEAARRALSPPGKAELLAAVPATSAQDIIDQLRLVAELREMIAVSGPLGLGGLLLMEGLFSRLDNPTSILDAEEVLAVADLIGLARGVRDRLLGLGQRFDLLAQAGVKIHPLPQLSSRIVSVIDEHGLVRSSASRGLAQIRDRLRSVRGRIHKALEGIVNSRDVARVVQDDFVTLRSDRYVILLRPEFKGLLDGIVHDHSRSGASVYVEPLEVVDLNNQVASLLDEEREEIRRIFKELSDEIRLHIEELAENYSLLAWLDAYQARAVYAADTNSVFPELVDEGFSLPGARHPLLLAAGEDVVPMDVVQLPSSLATVISGANMGGKTVALKIAGLFPLMVRCGLMIPAREGAKLCFLGRVMADIGEDQDIRGRISSFSGHMLKIKAILETVGQGDLVLLDELGGATDPAEGAALAMGILDALVRLGARVVVTTHLTHLKAYAMGRPEMTNVSVEFHPETLRPTFKLLYDMPGESHAIAVAERIGLPAEVIAAARSYFGEGGAGTGRLIQTLREKIGAVEELREGLAQKDGKLDVELAEISAAREELVEEFRREARDLIRGAERQILSLQKAVKTGLTRERGAPLRELESIKLTVEASLGTRLEKKRPDPPVGSKVLIKALDKEGIVESVLDRGQVEVSVGKMRFRADLDDLTVIHGPSDKKSSSKKKQVRVDIPLVVPRREVNVIGYRVEEAIPVVERAVDAAFRGGLSSVNIIHGKGTGRLKQAVWDCLAGHALVRGLHMADPILGGAGVTVVELELS